MAMVTTDEELRDLLIKAKRISVVGLSNRPVRPSDGVADYLQRQGYEIYPINPTLLGETVLGCQVYAALASLPESPDIVDVFRRSIYVADRVEQARATGANVLWTQLGIRDNAAIQRASEAGLLVVADRCIAVEHRRLGIGSVSR